MVGCTGYFYDHRTPKISFQIFTGTTQDMSTKFYFSLGSRKFKGQVWKANKKRSNLKKICIKTIFF